jgi:drug/metabolite transporter (DMT)-like permease
LSPEALALVLAGAACHALWNVAAKHSAAGAAQGAGSAFALVWLSGLVSVAIAVPLLALVWPTQARFTPAMWTAIVASSGLHVVYSLVLQQGYRVGDFATVYPVARGSGPMFTVAAAVLLLGERPSAAGWAGVAAVLAGVFVRAGGLRAGGARRGLGVAWGLATGACIAGYTLVDGWAIKTLAMLPLAFYGCGLVLRSLLLAPFALRRGADLRAQWRHQRRAVLVVGVLSPAAYLLVLMAVQRAPLAYVAPVREVSMLFATFLGAKLLKEAVRPAQLAGAALMLGGVACMALAK